MHKRKQQRLSRAKRTRMRIRKQNIERLTVNVTNKHIYASVISADGSKVLATGSTLNKEFCGSKVSVEAASKVGELVAKNAIKAGIEKVAFDRSGFKYHGRVKALADSARVSGLSF